MFVLGELFLRFDLLECGVGMWVGLMFVCYELICVDVEGVKWE